MRAYSAPQSSPDPLAGFFRSEKGVRNRRRREDGGERLVQLGEIFFVVFFLLR